MPYEPVLDWNSGPRGPLLPLEREQCGTAPNRACKAHRARVRAWRAHRPCGEGLEALKYINVNVR